MDEVQKSKLVLKMREVAGEMTNLSLLISKINKDRGQELLNASAMLDEWADDVLDDLEEEE